MKGAKVKKRKSKVPSADVRYCCLLFALIKGLKRAELTVQRDGNGYVLLIADERFQDGFMAGIRVQDDAISIGVAELDEEGQMIEFEIEAEGLPLNDLETLLDALLTIANDCYGIDEFAEARKAFRRAMPEYDEYSLLAHYLVDVDVVGIAKSLGLMKE